jgi:hypothetical protein
MKAEYGFENGIEHLDIWVDKKEDSVSDRKSLVNFIDNLKLGEDTYISDLSSVGGSENVWLGYRIRYGTNVTRLIKQKRIRDLQLELEELTK